MEQTARDASSGRIANESGPNARMNIDLHIERLVLNGLSATGDDGAAIQAALEIELTRLLAADGLRGVSACVLRNLSGGQIQLTVESKPVHTGNQIAQAVYSGLNSLRPAPHANRNGGRRRA